jgi:hypothetical protein
MSYLPRNAPRVKDSRQRSALPALGPGFPEVGNGIPGLPESYKRFATGGDQVIDYNDASGKWRAHVFLASGTFVANRDLEVEYLVVAGGGGGGTFNRGGAGAGGYRSSVQGEPSGGGAAAEPVLSLTAGSYTITVGAGGPGNIANSKGTNTSLHTFVVSEGGGGCPQHNNQGGQNGGSGGGVGYRTVAGINLGGLGAAGQGYRGGNSNDGSGGLTGGGGAGGQGVDGFFTAGGPGVTSAITGTPTLYAQGGHSASITSNTARGSGGDGRSFGEALPGIAGIVVLRYRRAA